MGEVARRGAQPDVHGEGGIRQRPATGSIVAGTGAMVTLGSIFLPWYVVHLQITGYASLSVFAMLRVGNMHLLCSPPAGASCPTSASVDALAAGAWDWRALIAVGAASILLLLVFRGINRGRSGGRMPHRQAVAVVAAALAVCILAAMAVNPLTVSGAAAIGMSTSLSYGAAIGMVGAVGAIIGGLLLTDGTVEGSDEPGEPGGRRAPRAR